MKQTNGQQLNYRDININYKGMALLGGGVY